MTTVCAWCVRERLQVEPAGVVSHSICSMHTLRLTAGMRAAVAAEHHGHQRANAEMDEKAARLLAERSRSRGMEVAA